MRKWLWVWIAMVTGAWSASPMARAAGGFEGSRCDMNALDYTERSSDILLQQIATAKAQKRHCKLARHWLELELQYPELAMRQHALKGSIEALAAGNYVREMIASFMDFVEIHRAHPDREYLLSLVSQTTYNNLPESGCTSPRAFSAGTGDTGYSALQEAIDLADSFLLQFPKSQYRKAIEKNRLEMEELSTEQELCVGDFYAKQAEISGETRYLRAALTRYENATQHPENAFTRRALEGVATTAEALAKAPDVGADEKQFFSRLAADYRRELQEKAK